MRLYFYPFIICQGVTVLASRLGFLYIRLTFNKIQRKDVYVFSFNLFVYLDDGLANLLVLDQESTQFIESCYFVGE